MTVVEALTRSITRAEEENVQLRAMVEELQRRLSEKETDIGQAG